MPEITFVIPAFNAAATIGDAIRSVLAQTRSDLEVIIIDDGSTDETSVAADSFGDARLSLVRRSNRGVAASRNLGLVMARGEFICFLDADDALKPEFSAATLGAIGASDAISTAYLDTGSSLRPTEHAWFPSIEELGMSRLRSSNPLAIGATVFRTDTLRQVVHALGEAFPTDSTVEDWELLLRFTSLGAKWATPLEHPLMLCRLRPDSRSSRIEEIWQDGLALLDRWTSRPQRESARRQWTVRQLARALFAQQPEAATRMLGSLCKLDEQDAPTLAGALRVLARRHHATTGQPIGFEPLRNRLAPIETSLAERCAAEALAPSWHDLALRAAKMLSAHERLVLFGFGRNGREASRALASAGIPHTIVDDDPATRCPNRISAADIGARDVVLVTPDDRRDIMERLRSSGAARVLSPADLIRPDAAAA